MKSGGSKIFGITLILLAAAAGLAWLTFDRLKGRTDPGGGNRSTKPVPVEVVQIEHGSIAQQRIFSGELEALAEFVVAPKVGGRVERVLVNIADTVERDQVVAELDNAEYVQAVAQARADLAVAKANLSEARSSLETADRELERSASLLKRGIASDSEFDAIRQERMVKQAQLKVAEAQVVKAEAALQTANIRLGYTQVTAGWSGGDSDRLVAERYVDEGQTVAANAPLLLIVDMDPIVGVVYVTERDYAHLQPGQKATLTTDAYPGETFTGHIDRIAPVFRKATRQARIELLVDNPRHRLKPGMFIRVNVVLTRLADAVIVPEQALTKRNDRYGVFIVGDDGRSVAWHAVDVGIRDGGRVQITGEELSGRVVTLGQQLVDDGASITIPAERRQKGAGDDEADS